MKSMEVYLIRHGKTEANEKRFYCGKSDISLSKSGIKELNEIKEGTVYPKCDCYYTSGAKRANETFKILFPQEEYFENNMFWEYDFGSFEMKSYDMLKEDKDYINWITDKEGIVSCPNGESKKQYNERIQNAFLELLENSFRDKKASICIVCHGGTIGTILEIFYDNSKSFYEHQPTCGRGYRLLIEKNKEVKILEVTDI